MKKFLLPLLVFCSILFISCKDPEFKFEANIEMTSEFIAKSLDEDKSASNAGGSSEFKIEGIEDKEAEEILRALGGNESFVTLSFATELSGFSLKKLYAKQGTTAQGWISFENPMPDKLITAFNKFAEEQKDSIKMNISGDKKRVSYTCTFNEDVVFFDSKENGDEEIDISKAGDSSKSSKDFTMKIRGGKIIIESTKNVEGLKAKIVLEKLKGVASSND